MESEEDSWKSDLFSPRLGSLPEARHTCQRWVLHCGVDRTFHSSPEQHPRPDEIITMMSSASSEHTGHDRPNFFMLSRPHESGACPFVSSLQKKRNVLFFFYTDMPFILILPFLHRSLSVSPYASSHTEHLLFHCSSSAPLFHTFLIPLCHSALIWGHLLSISSRF